MILSITQEDIDTSRRLGECVEYDPLTQDPVAVALLRQTGENWESGLSQAWFGNNPGPQKILNFPHKLTKQIWSFLSCDEFDPGDYELKEHPQNNEPSQA